MSHMSHVSHVSKVSTVSRAQSVSALVRARLCAAAEEICALLERTVAGYEHELSRVKLQEPRGTRDRAARTRAEEEPEPYRLRSLNPEKQQREEEPRAQRHTTGVQIASPADVQIASPAGVQITSPADVQIASPAGVQITSPAGVQIASRSEEELHVKEEPDEQLQSVPFAPVTVKTEDDEDESPELHHGSSEETREEPDGEPRTTGAEAACSSDHRPYSCSDSEEQREEQRELVVKPHRCPECGKRFLRKDHLQGHMIIHTGERPHKCSFCEKTFIRQNHLKTHLRNHTGERPYSCSFCNRGFTTKALLTPHLRIHTGDRPFRCSECHKGFIQRSHLRAHEKTHRRERTFSCSVCGRVFYERGELMVHSRQAHPD